jgi:hypothetical protein
MPRPPKPKRRNKTRARAPKGVTLARLRELVLALPGTTERPSYGTAGFRANDKLIVRVLPDDEHVVIHVSLEQREVLLGSLPEIFSLTPHYEAYPWVIVRLAAIDETLLKDLLAEAWGLAVPGVRVTGGK